MLEYLKSITRILSAWIGSVVAIVVSGCTIGPVLIFLGFGLTSLLALLPAIGATWLLQRVGLAPLDMVVTLHGTFVWVCLVLGAIYPMIALVFAVGRRENAKLPNIIGHLDIADYKNSAWATLASAPFLSFALNNVIRNPKYIASPHNLGLDQAWLYWMEQCQGVLSLEFPGVHHHAFSGVSGGLLLAYHVWFVKTLVFSELAASVARGDALGFVMRERR